MNKNKEKLAEEENIDFQLEEQTRLKKWCKDYNIPEWVVEQSVKILIYMNFDPFKGDIEIEAQRQLYQPVSYISALGGKILWDKKKIPIMKTEKPSFEERYEKKFQLWKESKEILRIKKEVLKCINEVKSPEDLFKFRSRIQNLIENINETNSKKPELIQELEEIKTNTMDELAMAYMEIKNDFGG